MVLFCMGIGTNSELGAIMVEPGVISLILMFKQLFSPHKLQHLQQRLIQQQVASLSHGLHLTTTALQ